MAKKFNAAMFDKIKDALKKTEKSGSFANVMKFPAGHTYTLRLIPNVENIDDTFFHHYVNQLTSKKDGSFVSCISLKTFGERDPMHEARWKLYKEWKDTKPDKDEKFDNPIKEKEQWFVNVYVVDDPANDENNGTVKILNMGPQLKKKVDDAMTGDRADEFGASIFDLTKDGCDFKIKAEEKGVYTTYENSFFTTKSKLNLSDDEIDEIYKNVHDLKGVYNVKTSDEIQELLNEHFFCDGEAPEKEERKPLKKVEKTEKKVEKKTEKKVTKPVVEDDDNDEIPMFDTPEEDDSVLDELLDGLDEE